MGPPWKKRLGTLLVHGRFNDAFTNKEYVAQSFGCIFIVLQHAKSSVTMKLHVCVCVCVCVCAYTGCAAVYDSFSIAKFILRFMHSF